MSANSCPQCGAALSVDSIDLEQGLAHCASCDANFPLAEVVRGQRPLQEVVRHTPEHCAIFSRHEAGRQVWILEAKFFLPKVFWIGLGFGVFSLLIATIISFDSLQTVFQFLGGADSGNKNNEGMGQLFGGLVFIFELLFLLPLLLTIVFNTIFFLALFKGGVQVEIAGEKGLIKTGALFYFHKQEFLPQKVAQVRIDEPKQSKEGEILKSIVLPRKSGQAYITLLPQDRLEWIRTSLYLLLLEAEDKPLRQELLAQAKPMK